MLLQQYLPIRGILQDHRKVTTIDVHCNGCDHKHRWRIEDLIAQHKPWATVVDLARPWWCSRVRLAGCGTVRDRAVTGPVSPAPAGLSPLPLRLFGELLREGRHQAYFVQAPPDCRESLFLLSISGFIVAAVADCAEWLAS
jgi:hypothetical protein